MPELPEEIPLEYFENALKWLSEQPQVNPDKIVVMGASRNAELAIRRIHDSIFSSNSRGAGIGS